MGLGKNKITAYLLKNKGQRSGGMISGQYAYGWNSCGYGIIGIYLYGEAGWYIEYFK